ncbi:MAG: NADH-quinone oxidoreductase subunit NuoF, partial [Phycisphaerae bacterium]
KGYRSRGGYCAAEKALTTMRPEQVVEEVRNSGLRGRGGAGFPTGAKWGFLPANREITYLCVNFDESEPGTFNNRVLVETDPHQLVEGILIAGYATRATTAYVYIRGEFPEAYHRLQIALDEAYAAGILGRPAFGGSYGLDCFIHRGAGAYVCGEETGLIESIEGKRGWPRIKPPFPAVAGLFGRPTVVNNVETICCLPHIIERGADWFRSIGTQSSAGPKLYTISGPVNRPGCYEAPLGLTVRELIYGDDFGRGMAGGRKVKGVIPGGLSVGILTADELDCRLDFEDPSKYGLLGLGTAGAMVISEEVDIRRVLLNAARFFAHESCGQCTQCREGTGWMYMLARRLAAGAGRIRDLDILEEQSTGMGMMPGCSICGLSDGAAWVVRTIVRKYRKELEAHIAAQEPGRVEEVLSRTVPSVYEAPLYGWRTQPKALQAREV